MKMKRILLCILCLIIIFAFSACGFIGPQKYECDVETVKSAQIVRLDRFDKEKKHYVYTVLADIDDVPLFVEKLNKIEHSVNWGEPGIIKTRYVVIRIDYLNGEFDYLYPNAQNFYRNGQYNNGYFFFNEEQFNSLVNEYVENDAEQIKE